MTTNTTTSAANAGSAKQKRPANYNTSTTSQQFRILEWLQREPINTFEARNILDVAHIAGRIMELRAKGHNIIMTKVDVHNGKARHRIGQYTLLPKVARDD